MQKTAQQTYGSLMALFSALFFGSYGVWSRLIGDDMENFFQGWTRALIILILIVPLTLWRREMIKIASQDRKWLAIFLAFTSMTQAPIFYAFNHMDIGTASLLFFVSMFLTMNAIGFSFFKEKLDTVKILAIICAIAGMYFVFSFSISSFTFFAACMAIVNGIASGGEVAFSKKLSSNYSPLYLTLLSWIIILISNSVISLALGETQIVPTFSTVWFWQLCYSVTSLFAFWLVIEGFKRIDATIGSLIGLLEIVFGVVLGIILFSETLSAHVAIGGLLIIFAAAIPQFYGLSKKNSQKDISHVID